MFVPFIYELRSRGVPVGATEAVNLARALDAGLRLRRPRLGAAAQPVDLDARPVRQRLFVVLLVL